MPRLLFITERFAPDLGGVARSARRTAEAIAGLGVECEVLAWTKTLPPGQLETAASGTGLTLHRLGLFANWDVSLQHTLNVMEWLHGRRPFAAIWGHYLYPAGFMAVLLAETLGIGSLVSARGNDIDRIMFPPGDFARLRWTLERASAVLAVSHDLARKISVLLGSSDRVQVVHNSVDAETFAPAVPDAALRQALGIGPREAVLGFCGELRYKKGLPFLLAAAAEVSRVREACLLVIGEVRPREQPALSEFFGETRGGPRVLVTGHLEASAEVARHLNLCDIVLQPSVWDGLPNAVLEAMACQRVVLASDAGGIPEAIEHGASGILVPRSQLHRLGEAVVELLAQPAERRAEIALAARRRVLEKFHPTIEAESLRAALQGVMPSTFRKPRSAAAGPAAR